MYLPEKGRGVLGGSGSGEDGVVALEGPKGEEGEREDKTEDKTEDKDKRVLGEVRGEGKGKGEEERGGVREYGGRGEVR